jgi:hypothetical protein
MQKLFELFEEIGLPYFRQGSMSDEQYQPSFFTFWNIDTPNDSFYDNKATRYIEYVQVGLYTNDAKNIYSVMDDFIKKAKEKGFVVEGRAQDANADKESYFGRVCYLRIINKSED